MVRPLMPNIPLSPPDEAANERREAVARGGARPGFMRAADHIGDKLPPQKPELIRGVLRQGHKLMLAAQSKAGKTWSMIALALAVANGYERLEGEGWRDGEGATWLGRECRRGEVALFDGEMDVASLWHRIDLVARAMWPDEPPSVRRARGERLSVRSLRGDRETTIDDVLGILDEGYGEEPPALVVIDPIYKLMDGDENSNSETRPFLKSLDAIAAWGPSVAVTHHHAKGRAGERSVIDRAAGAGTFGRDPDAFIDLNALDIREGTDAWRRLERALPRLDGEASQEWQGRLRESRVLRANYVLREFKDRWGGELLFDFPLLVPIDGFSDVPEEGSAEAARSAGAQANADAADERWGDLDALIQEAVEAVEARGATPTRRAVHEELRRVCGEDGEVACPTYRAFEKATKPDGRSAWGVSPEAPYALYRK